MKKQHKKKKLTCKNIGVDCDAVFEGDTEEEVMQKAAEHAATEHNLPQIPPALHQKCISAIQNTDN